MNMCTYPLLCRQEQVSLTSSILHSILAVDVPSCNKYSCQSGLCDGFAGSVDKRSRRHTTEPDRAIRRLASRSSTCYHSHHTTCWKGREVIAPQKVKLPNIILPELNLVVVSGQWHGKQPPDPDWYEEVGRLRAAKIDNNLMILMSPSCIFVDRDVVCKNKSYIWLCW